jgi:peptidoglycan/LPS O-acetylase OafA/YrhL
LGSARDFWLRRWFRTLPNYYLFLLVNILLVELAFGPGRYSWQHAFFLQNLAWAEEMPFFFPEAFSLAIDEWFYLVLPLLVGLAAMAWRSSTRNAFIVATLLLIVLPTVARGLASPPSEVDGNAFKDWDERFRRVTIYHLDATGWGVLGAIVSRWHGGAWKAQQGRRAAIGVAGMVAGLALLWGFYVEADLVMRFARVVNVASLTLIGSGTFLALPWVAGIPAAASKAVHWTVDHISQYSYSIYLLHLPLLYLFDHLRPPEAMRSVPLVLLAAALWAVLVFVGSAAVHHAFEKPVSDLRERYTRKIDASPFGPAPPP